MIRAYYDADGSPALAADRHYVTELIATMNVQHQSMRKLLPLIILAFVGIAMTSGCVYRQNISQGNLIKQEDLDQAEVGMTRNQIRFLLGTPMIDDPFHAGRWDYAYYFKLGREDVTFTRWVSIIFEGDKVIEIRKDQPLNPDL
jgi:outer membrane protein assembly factor BamE